MYFIQANRISEENLHTFEVRNEIMFFDLLPINYAIQWFETKKRLAMEKMLKKRVDSIEWKKKIEKNNII